MYTVKEILLPLVIQSMVDGRYAKLYMGTYQHPLPKINSNTLHEWQISTSPCSTNHLILVCTQYNHNQ